MNKEWVLTQESFDALLAWLDPNRELAGRKYEDIRTRLIKIFSCRGCYEPEDLADETINRVTKKLKDIESSFVGERARYFYGVANKVHMEYLRRKPAPPRPRQRARRDSRTPTCFPTTARSRRRCANTRGSTRARTSRDTCGGCARWP